MIMPTISNYGGECSMLVLLTNKIIRNSWQTETSNTRSQIKIKKHNAKQSSSFVNSRIKLIDLKGFGCERLKLIK